MHACRPPRQHPDADQRVHALTTVHTYPVNDLIDHDTDSDDCACGPLIEPVPAEDGSMGWLIVHHALDGREHREPDHDGPCCR